MTLTQVRKKGNVRIVHVDDAIKQRCSSFGLCEQCLVHVSAVVCNGYQMIVCDDRLMAVPEWICRGIEI